MGLRVYELRSSYLLVLVILVSPSNGSQGKVSLPFPSSFHTCTFIYISIFISTIEVIDVGGKTLSRGTDRGMAYARFKAHKFSYLNITNIGSDYVLKGSECGLACVNTPSCFSFNLAAFSDIMSGKILCELLPSDIYNNSKKLVASQLLHHYSIPVSENSTKRTRISFILNLVQCQCHFQKRSTVS